MRGLTMSHRRLMKANYRCAVVIRQVWGACSRAARPSTLCGRCAVVRSCGRLLVRPICHALMQWDRRSPAVYYSHMFWQVFTHAHIQTAYKCTNIWKLYAYSIHSVVLRSNHTQIPTFRIKTSSVIHRDGLPKNRNPWNLVNNRDARV